MQQLRTGSHGAGGAARDSQPKPTSQLGSVQAQRPQEHGGTQQNSQVGKVAAGAASDPQLKQTIQHATAQPQRPQEHCGAQHKPQTRAATRAASCDTASNPAPKTGAQSGSAQASRAWRLSGAQHKPELGSQAVCGTVRNLLAKSGAQPHLPSQAPGGTHRRPGRPCGPASNAQAKLGKQQNPAQQQPFQVLDGSQQKAQIGGHPERGAASRLQPHACPQPVLPCGSGAGQKPQTGDQIARETASNMQSKLGTQHCLAQPPRACDLVSMQKLQTGSCEASSAGTGSNLKPAPIPQHAQPRRPVEPSTAQDKPRISGGEGSSAAGDLQPARAQPLVLAQQKAQISAHEALSRLADDVQPTLAPPPGPCKPTEHGQSAKIESEEGAGSKAECKDEGAHAEPKLAAGREAPERLSRGRTSWPAPASMSAGSLGATFLQRVRTGGAPPPLQAKQGDIDALASGAQGGASVDRGRSFLQQLFHKRAA